MHIFNISLPTPLNLPRSLDGFQRWGDDLVDRWDGTHLIRTVPSGRGHIPYLATASGAVEDPLLRITVQAPEHQQLVEQTVRSTFVLPPPGYETLLRADPIIARLDARFPGLRPVRQHDLLTALIRAISAQQVNLRWAATTRRRLAETFGEQHDVAGQIVYSFNAERLASVAVADIRALQFTTRKAEYIIGSAQAIASGHLDLATLAALPDDEVISRLTALRGIGLWTAEWILARTLGRPRVVAGDLGVRKVVAAAYLQMPIASEAEVRGATAHWGESSAIAQALLLHGYSRPESDE